MLKWLKWLVVTVGPLGLLAKMVVDKRRTRVSSDGSKILRYLAKHTSGLVPALASRLKLTPDATSMILAELEGQGFVQLSEDQGTGHARIAAITKAGRERVA